MKPRIRFAFPLVLLLLVMAFAGVSHGQEVDTPERSRTGSTSSSTPKRAPGVLSGGSKRSRPIFSEGNCRAASPNGSRGC